MQDNVKVHLSWLPKQGNPRDRTAKACEMTSTMGKATLKTIPVTAKWELVNASM